MLRDSWKQELLKYSDEKLYEKVVKGTFEKPQQRLKDQQRNVKELVKLKKEDLVLDIGCGTGKYLAIFSHEAKIVGLDFSPASLKVARETVFRYGKRENVFLCQGLAQKLPFKENTFDKVLCIDVVEHLPFADFKGMLKEIHKVLKNGGSLFIYTPNRLHFSEFVKQILNLKEEGHIGLRTPKELLRTLRHFHFNIKKFYFRPSHLPFIRKIENVLMNLPLIGILFQKRICIEAVKEI